MSRERQIIEMIDTMETNTFLFPVGWGDIIQTSNEPWSYRMYNSGSKGKNRYHTFEIYEDAKKVLTIKFSGNNVLIDHSMKRAFTSTQVLEYVQGIWKELHSFGNHAEGMRTLRVELNKVKKEIDTKKLEAEQIQERITNYKQLKKDGKI